MKKSTLPSILLLAVCLLGSSALLPAQVVTTLPAVLGTVHRYTSDTLSVNLTGAREPLKYAVTKATIYMDTKGNNVPVTAAAPGVPVAVFYERDGDQLFARKVIVGATTVSSPAPSGILSIGNAGQIPPASPPEEPPSPEQYFINERK